MFDDIVGLPIDSQNEKNKILFRILRGIFCLTMGVVCLCFAKSGIFTILLCRELGLNTSAKIRNDISNNMEVIDIVKNPRKTDSTNQ